jgi:hypothetical protein
VTTGEHTITLSADMEPQRYDRNPYWPFSRSQIDLRSFMQLIRDKGYTRVILMDHATCARIDLKVVET